MMLNFKTTNFISPQDLSRINEKNRDEVGHDLNEIKITHHTHPSGSLSTNLPTSTKEDEIKMQKRSSCSTNKVNSKIPKTSQASPDNTSGKLNLDTPPKCDQKKLRKAWRLGKSGNLNQNKAITQQHTQEFYSLGNSLNKNDTASLISGSQVTSQMRSSQETKSSMTMSMNKPNKKMKIKTAKKINFSDRMLSSKLYSIKRQEIFLYDRKGRNKLTNKSLTTNVERSEKSNNSNSSFIPRSSMKPTNKKHSNCSSKVKFLNAKSNKNWDMFYGTKTKIMAKVDLSESRNSFLNSIDHPKKLKGKTFSTENSRTYANISAKRVIKSKLKS
jgi:hypothetical protein